MCEWSSPSTPEAARMAASNSGKCRRLRRDMGGKLWLDLTSERKSRPLELVTVTRPLLLVTFLLVCSQLQLFLQLKEVGTWTLNSTLMTSQVLRFFASKVYWYLDEIVVDSRRALKSGVKKNFDTSKKGSRLLQNAFKRDFFSPCDCGTSTNITGENVSRFSSSVCHLKLNFCDFSCVVQHVARSSEWNSTSKSSSATTCFVAKNWKFVFDPVRAICRR